MKEYSRLAADIDLSAICENMEAMKQNIGKDSKIIGVIKADGYGHGALQIAKILRDKPYMWGFAVATGDEALRLRKDGITNPIIVIGAVFPEQFSELIKNEIRLTIYSGEQIPGLIESAKSVGKPIYAHLKIDTGMGRIGFNVNTDSAKKIKGLIESEWIETEGIFTHFARADETDKSFANRQHELFVKIIDDLNKEGISFKYHHCANSAGIIDGIGTEGELVRGGISVYGLYPSEEVNKENVRLKPALSLHSKIIFVKEVEPGTPISYGGTFVSDRKMKIATVPVGYGDGYPRGLSNKGYVLIHGKTANILGRVCMDQMMVDVSDIADVKFGDRVTLVGTDGDKSIAVEDLSELCGRFNYEFVCDLGKRIPRNYYFDGKLIEQVDYF